MDGTVPVQYQHWALLDFRNKFWRESFCWEKYSKMGVESLYLFHSKNSTYDGTRDLRLCAFALENEIL